MKCTTLICTTLASTLIIAAGCKKEAKPSEAAKPSAAATAKPSAAATAKAVAPEAAKDPNR